MLFDPKWDRKNLVKDFYEFVKQKNPDETFYYFDAQRCAVGQFMDYKEIPISEWGPNWFKWRHPLEIYAIGAKTFGEVAERMQGVLEPAPAEETAWAKFMPKLFGRS